MAIQPSTLLETHPAGTTNVGGIINGNWERLEALFNAALANTDGGYNSFWKALLRNATLPTDAASIEWDPAASVPLPIFRAAVGMLTGTTPTINFKGARKQLLTLSGATTFSYSNLAAGREVELLITGDGSTRALSWPSGIVWESTAGTSIAAGKVASIRLISTTGLAAGVYAIFTVQP
jgi:hypothetical protein